MDKKRQKIAIWEPTDLLLTNIEKLSVEEYEIVGYFLNNITNESLNSLLIKNEKEIQNLEFDYLIISYENFKSTKEKLKNEYGLEEKVYTFEEFWVRDCEADINKKHYDMWKQMKEANIQLFKEKTVLIAGGGAGIGRECAIAFAYAGADVIIAGRNEERLRKVSQEVGRISKCDYIVWDVRNIDEYQEKFNQLEMIASRGLDIFINGAGVMDTKFLDFFSVTPEDFDNIIETNLKGAYFMCQWIAKYFMERKRKGNIVNIISNTGIVPTVKPYGLSKWGLMGLTKGLGHHLAQYGIIVNGIAPGEVATGALGWQEGDCPARRSHKNGRLAFPCEIAQSVMYLASFMGENMLGEVMICDGGDRTNHMRI